MGAETSPVYAPSFSQKTFCAPISMRVDFADSTAIATRADHRFGVLQAGDPRSELREKRRGFAPGLMHLPVAGDDWFAHACLPGTPFPALPRTPSRPVRPFN